MRKVALFALALIASAPAFAQGVASLKTGAILVSADGKRLGRVDTITSKDGAPVSLNLIFDSRFVHVPASTVTAGEDGRLTTSLSRDEVRKLK
ncbi:hypothetical protein [Sphingomonas montanisoli]|uniref:DUF2171 domain-containing protein n=1 Tax=Sphingomonas montanisoli TaxID=2606412 RepID=A0A5D9CAY9_9SPHN|nr:hypothetical protein [Sphingomonas montanisoli]TZG28889.1 hypothetical protein FYJ91_01725 [Sphingomonas montanisoli]